MGGFLVYVFFRFFSISIAASVIMIAMAIITALVCVAVTTVVFWVCFAAMPTSAQTITRAYAMSFLVAKFSRVINTATAVTIIVHVVGSMPAPSQPMFTRVAEMLAIVAIVIQPK